MLISRINMKKWSTLLVKSGIISIVWWFLSVFWLYGRVFPPSPHRGPTWTSHMSWQNPFSRLMFSQTALSGAEVMKQANLGVSSSPLQLSGELLLLFLLTTCNETSAPTSITLRSDVFSGETILQIIFTLTASSRLSLQIPFFWSACGVSFISLHFNAASVFMFRFY